MADESDKPTEEVDDEFYERADAFINLANEQLRAVSRSLVSASMMHATARFNVFLTAMKSDSREHLEANREKVIDYFLRSYRHSLNLHFDEYLANYGDFVDRGPPT